MKDKTKNYRISKEKIVFNDGSSKTQYFIEKRSFWFFFGNPLNHGESV